MDDSSQVEGPVKSKKKRRVVLPDESGFFPEPFLMDDSSQVEGPVKSKKKRKVVLPVLTEEMNRVIDDALEPGDPSEVLSEAFGFKITRNDIATLKEDKWLNDQVINFYMNLIMERSEISHITVYAFDAFFYPEILSKGHSAVKRWTKNVDIFCMNYILIPVHLNNHWTLCIVNMQEKWIAYCDSLGGHSATCLTAVLEYLEDESAAKNQPIFNRREWTVINVEDFPRQTNNSDCGVFVCQFAEYATREQPITFTQKNMPYFRRKMVLEIIFQTLLE